MNKTIRTALLTILSTLPEGTEISFYWQDGEPHMSMKLPGEDRRIVRYSKNKDGKGVVFPAAVH